MRTKYRSVNGIFSLNFYFTHPQEFEGVYRAKCACCSSILFLVAINFSCLSLWEWQLMKMNLEERNVQFKPGIKLNHNTYVGKKCLYFIILLTEFRGDWKNLIRTHLKIQLSCRAAVLRDISDCPLVVYHYWREIDWYNWIYSAHTVQIWSVPADYEELAGGIKGAVLWKWEPPPQLSETQK